MNSKKISIVFPSYKDIHKDSKDASNFGVSYLIASISRYIERMSQRRSRFPRHKSYIQIREIKTLLG